MGAKRAAGRGSEGWDEEDPTDETDEDEDFLDDDEDEEDDEWDDEEDADDVEEDEDDEPESACGFCQRPLNPHWTGDEDEGLVTDPVECEQCRVFFCSEGCLQQHWDSEHAAEEGV
ncbi:MAG: zinc finger MYND domain-containing protein [Planctomycetes bacterium]|jgi:hypothetical protein|nr:zinc finger MYND domain-containing protein [Planctomycetota bacterium]